MNTLTLLFFNSGMTAYAQLQQKHEFQNFNFDANLSHLDYTETVKKEMLSKSFFTSPFDRVEVVFASTDSTLIPAEIYQPDYLDSYIELSQIHGSSFRKNISVPLHSHILFETNEDLEFFIEKKYSNVHYFSSIFRWLEKIQPTSYKPHIFLNLYPYGADVAIFNYKKNILSKYLEFIQLQDLVDNLADFCEKNRINSEEVQIVLAGKTEEADRTKILQKVFSNVTGIDENPLKRNYYLLLG